MEKPTVTLNDAPRMENANLIDMFAAHVAAGMAANTELVVPEVIANKAYDVAEEMALVRKKRYFSENA